MTKVPTKKTQSPADQLARIETAEWENRRAMSELVERRAAAVRMQLEGDDVDEIHRGIATDEMIFSERARNYAAARAQIEPLVAEQEARERAAAELDRARKTLALVDQVIECDGRFREAACAMGGILSERGKVLDQIAALGAIEANTAATARDAVGEVIPALMEAGVPFYVFGRDAGAMTRRTFAERDRERLRLAGQMVRRLDSEDQAA